LGQSVEKQAGCHVTQICDTGALAIAIGELKALIQQFIGNQSQPINAALTDLQESVKVQNVPDINELLVNLQVKYASINEITAAIVSVQQHMNDNMLSSELEKLRAAIETHNASRNQNEQKLYDQLLQLIDSLKTSNAVQETKKNLQNLESKQGLTEDQLKSMLESALSPLKSILETFGTEITGVRSNIADVKSSLTEQSAQLAAIREALAELRAVQHADFELLKSYLKNHLELIEQQMYDYKELLLGQHQENTDNSSQKRNAAIQALETRIAELMQELDGLRSPTSPNKARITELESAAQRNSVRRGELEAQIAALQREIAQLRESSETERASATATIQQLNEEKATLQRLLDTCNENKTVLETSIQELTTEVQSLRERIVELEALPPQKDVEIETLRQTLEGKTTELLTLREQHDGLESMRAKLEIQLRDCEQSKVTLESALARCTQNSGNKNARHKSDLEAARKKAQADLLARQKDYETQIKKLEDEHREVVRKLSEEFDFSLDEELEAERKKCATIQVTFTKTVAEKDARISELEAELQARPANCDELQARISELEATVAQKDQELATRPTNCDELEARIAELESAVMQKDQELATRPTNCDELQARIADLEAEVAQKDQELA